MDDPPASTIKQRIKRHLHLAVPIGMAVVAMVAVLYTWHPKEPLEATAVYTNTDRLLMISNVWEDVPAGERLKNSHCPRVDALEARLPELRGIDPRERDYVSFIRGEAKC